MSKAAGEGLRDDSCHPNFKLRSFCATISWKLGKGIEQWKCTAYSQDQPLCSFMRPSAKAKGRKKEGCSRHWGEARLLSQQTHHVLQKIESQPWGAFLGFQSLMLFLQKQGLLGIILGICPSRYFCAKEFREKVGEGRALQLILFQYY